MLGILGTQFMYFVLMFTTLNRYLLLSLFKKRKMDDAVGLN